MKKFISDSLLRLKHLEKTKKAFHLSRSGYSSVSKVFSLFLLFLISLKPAFATDANWLSLQDNILFYKDGCGGCGKIEEYIKKHNINIPVEKIEISKPENADKFNQICDAMGINLMERKVPYLHADGDCYIGEKEIISYLESCKNSKTNEEKEACATEAKEEQKLTIPILIGAAIVDAVNPCAFAVLLILMSTVLASGQRKKALWAGIFFSLSIFLSYFLMGLGLYSVLASFTMSNLFTKFIGLLAILIGAFNIKDYFWYGKFFLMEVPLSWRPKMKKIIQSVTSPGGAFLVGFVVSLFLLPCTSGPYVVIISMLGHKETYWNAFFLLLLYNIIFVFPMVLITIGSYFGMDVRKADRKRQRNLSNLHLAAGVIMIAMGIWILLGFF